MRKYILAICVFSIHTFANTSKYQLFIDDSEKNVDKTKKEDLKSVVNNFKDSAMLFLKKGGLHSATWYNPHGARTASGEKFHRDSLTAAYNFSKMHSLLKVTNIATSQFVLVRVTDRMGNKSKNHIDLSKSAFDSIGNPSTGRIKVIVEEVITQ
jgi:rare lipoprotein A (peptidoglycan hydrolase)